MSTRTSVPFGTIVETLAKEKLAEYEPVINEATQMSLLFGYRRRIAGHFFGFILYQASRTFGRLTCEVAVSRNGEYPYYRWRDEPRISVAGYRERVHMVNRGVDQTDIYGSQQELLPLLLGLTQDAEVALRRLAEKVVPLVTEEYRRWQPLFRQWKQAEERAGQQEVTELRYPELEGEEVARELLLETLGKGNFDRFLGPKKFQYRNADFRNCHTYLFARALEFLDPPELPESGRDEDEAPQFEDERKQPLVDPISSLSGRQPQCESVDMAVSTSLRATQWAFLKSFAALEAFFGKELVELAKPEPKAEDEVSLDELYEGIMESYGVEAGQPNPEPEPAAEEVAAPDSPPKEEQPSRERVDPFELIGEQLDADPFDLLGSQLGL